ncbi:hypothetical protein AB0E63_17625 [Kribbella sp. NPDC026596]|uniref:hypothetical protein n=1 Tax=Kribbella sp. NPDC026596 TaxID=3155122 RepID=UPI0033DBC7E1
MANVAAERPYGPGGAETRHGLKIFSAGTKLYVPDGFGGMGWETVEVVGRGRGSARYVAVAVQTHQLTNWRVKAVHSPAALRQIQRIRANRPGFWLHPATYNDLTTQAYHDALLEIATELSERSEV